MASKLDRLKARMANMRKQTEVIGRNVLHTGETLILGAGGAYLEGRMSKRGGTPEEDGEWGYKGVPYLYMGGAIAFLTGLFAGERYSADLFAGGTGLVGGHLFRTMYESGLEARDKAPATSGRRAPPRQMGTPSPMNSYAVPMGSAFDNIPTGAQ